MTEGQTVGFTASRTCHGLQLLWAGELDAAREVLHQELTEYERLGRYLVRAEPLLYLAEVECRAGNWELAARHAQEEYEIDVGSKWVPGQGHTLFFPKMMVAALTGDVDAARSDAEEGLRQCLRNEDLLDASCHRAVLGFLELSLSNPAAAMERLEPVLAFLDGIGSPEPGMATAGRGRGLISAARGDLSAARSALEQALVEHRRVPDPAGEGRGGAESQAEARRPLPPGAGA